MLSRDFVFNSTSSMRMDPSGPLQFDKTQHAKSSEDLLECRPQGGNTAKSCQILRSPASEIQKSSHNIQ